MAVTLTDAAARGISHDGLPTTFPAGSKLQYRTGAPPGANAAPTGSLVHEITLPATPWGAAASRGTPKNGTWSVSSSGGTMGHFRLITASDTGAATQNEARIEGTITVTGGGGDLTVDNVVMGSGQTFTENTFTVSL